jgi:WD40 repeat protein
VKRFARREFKHSIDTRYYKKFESVFAQHTDGFMTNSISFCKSQALTGTNDSSGLMATARGARVMLWKLQQRENKDKDDEFDNSPDQIEPIANITKFMEEITFVQLREDGQTMLVGDKNGKIDLMELKNKVILRSYPAEHKNQINWLDFSSNRRQFISCSNETSWKLFDIQSNNKCIYSCNAAHSDNIR